MHHSHVLNAVNKSKLTMQFKGKLGCVPAEFLVDSGSGVNCIGAEIAQKHGIGWDSASDVQVTMPGGKCCLVLGKFKACLATGMSVLNCVSWHAFDRLL